MTLSDLLNKISVNDQSSDDILATEIKVNVDRFINLKDTSISVIRDTGKPTLIIISASHEED
jgi:hypothetical protein